MTEEEFWGALRGAGITPTRRVGPRQWVGMNRDREIIPIPDPNGLTPEQRQAAYEMLNLNYGSTCH